MKKKLLALSLISCVLCVLNAEDSILNNVESTINNANAGESVLATKDQTTKNYADSHLRIRQSESQYYNENYQTTQNYQELSEEQLNLLKASLRAQNLNALQQSFFRKKYSGFENTREIEFENNKTQKIRTRFAMATTLIFENEIESYILGDSTGFKIDEIPNIANALAIKPLLIGVDTSLTIFTKDKRIHNFYLFSTDYRNRSNSDLIVYIQDEVAKAQKFEKQAELERDYLILEEGIAKVKVKKADIQRNFRQKALKKNEWLLAEEIFSDKKFTYFKYSKDKMPQVPSIFAVIDKQDSPIETRIIGDYLIAETINPKWSIKSEDSYVCVERVEKKKDKSTPANLNLEPKIDSFSNHKYSKTHRKLLGLPQ